MADDFDAPLDDFQEYINEQEASENGKEAAVIYGSL